MHYLVTTTRATTPRAALSTTSPRRTGYEQTASRPRPRRDLYDIPDDPRGDVREDLGGNRRSLFTDSREEPHQRRRAGPRVQAGGPLRSSRSSTGTSLHHGHRRPHHRAPSRRSRTSSESSWDWRGPPPGRGHRPAILPDAREGAARGVLAEARGSPGAGLEDQGGQIDGSQDSRWSESLAWGRRTVVAKAKEAVPGPQRRGLRQPRCSTRRSG